MFESRYDTGIDNLSIFLIQLILCISYKDIFHFTVVEQCEEWSIIRAFFFFLVWFILPPISHQDFVWDQQNLYIVYIVMFFF
jgi:hypothetical protein